MHNRASHTFLDNKVSKQLFLPEWMHAISTLPIIGQTTFLLSTHSHYRCLASCISISPWRSLLSRGPLRQKKIRWRLAPSLGCLSKITPDPGTDSRGRFGWGWNTKGKGHCFPCPASGGAALQTRPASNLQMKPNSHWLNCRGTPGASASPKALCIWIRSRGCLS